MKQPWDEGAIFVMINDQHRQTLKNNISSVRSIADLLRSLSQTEKRSLIRELQPNDYLKQHLQVFSLTVGLQIDLKINLSQYRLHRLSDEAYLSLSDYNIPIRVDGIFYNASYSSINFQGKELELAKVYLVLNHLFGESSHLFDQHKASFTFPLFAEICKESGSYNYMIIVQDYRGDLEFSIRRCVDEWVSPSKMLHHEPYDKEFSLEEIHFFFSYFYGYLLGRWEEMQQDIIRSFYRDIQSNHILYGYCEKDGFFELIYKDEEEKNNFLKQRFQFS